MMYRPSSAAFTVGLVLIVLATAGIVYLAFLFCNRAPASWFCDYGESPSPKTACGVRFSYRRVGIPCTVLLCVCNALCFFIYGVCLYSVFLCLAMILMLLIALSDRKYTIIPDQFNAALALLCTAGAVCDLLSGQFFITSWWSPLAGSVCGAALFLLLNLFSRALYKKDGIGFGDVKLFGALGILLGFPAVFLSFIILLFTAFFHILFLLATKKVKSGFYLPMGPYICAGCALLILLRTPVYHFVGWYLQLLGQ